MNIKRISAQAGFSLIEVLVSAVILSVGVLGVAGMQVASLQQNRTALLRSEAQNLAWDLVDRMIANPDGAYSPTGFATDPSLTTNCNSADCNQDQMAAFDITQWKCSINGLDGSGSQHAACATLGVNGSLPGGQGQIEDSTTTGGLCDMSAAQADGEYCVIVRWLNTDGSSYSRVMVRTRVKFAPPPSP